MAERQPPADFLKILNDVLDADEQIKQGEGSHDGGGGVIGGQADDGQWFTQQFDEIADRNARAIADAKAKADARAEAGRCGVGDREAPGGDGTSQRSIDPDVADFERGDFEISFSSDEEEYERLEDHENDSISYSSEETASDWSDHYTKEPMDAVIRDLGVDPNDHCGLSECVCEFGHDEAADRPCHCSQDNPVASTVTCVECAMVAFDELGAHDENAIPVAHPRPEVDDEEAQERFRIWRIAVSSLLRAGELRILPGPRRFQPRAPRPQRRFGPARIEFPPSKEGILARGGGKRTLANRIGLESGVKPCTEGLPWETTTKEWVNSCPNSLNPEYRSEIRRCREIRCQDESIDPRNGLQIEVEEAVNRAAQRAADQAAQQAALFPNQPPAQRRRVQDIGQEEINNMVEEESNDVDARLYTQRPCTPNGSRYVCAEHWADTQRFHEVQGLLAAHRVAPCKGHIRAALDKFPEGFNSCVCEEPLDRWQCRYCFEKKLESLKRHFKHRVGSEWTGLMPLWRLGYKRQYHKNGEWANMRRLLTEFHPCLHDISGQDPNRRYLCGGKRSSEGNSVLDCRSCGGLIVLPPRLRVSPSQPTGQEAETQTEVVSQSVERDLALPDRRIAREQAPSPEPTTSPGRREIAVQTSPARRGTPSSEGLPPGSMYDTGTQTRQESDTLTEEVARGLPMMEPERRRYPQADSGITSEIATPHTFNAAIQTLPTHGNDHPSFENVVEQAVIPRNPGQHHQVAASPEEARPLPTQEVGNQTSLRQISAAPSIDPEPQEPPPLQPLAETAPEPQPPQGRVLRSRARAQDPLLELDDDGKTVQAQSRKRKR